jgi:hypothetical protein
LKSSRDRLTVKTKLPQDFYIFTALTILRLHLLQQTTVLPTMLASRQNKVNPFELDDDGEDDGGNWNDDDEWQEQYAAENQRLMEDYHHYRGGGKNNKASSASATSYYHDDRLIEQRHKFNDSLGKRSFFSHHIHHHVPGIVIAIQRHSSQFWKYGVLGVILVAIYIWNVEDRGEGDAYVSMIDEIPNDDYRLIILGERHSGTAWLQARLKECFPRSSVLSNLQRPGFFFQEEPTEDTQQQHDMIVVHVTLNIYDWLEQMRSSPEYAPNHVGKHKEGHIVPLPWKEFLEKPWTMDRPERDLPLQNATNTRCQLEFHYDQVVSCAEKATGGTDNPIYELRQDDGTAYESILQLRAAKLRNHQSVQNWKHVKKFLTLSYENTGKEFKSRLLSEIHQFADWTAACSGDVLPPLAEHTAIMSTEFFDYVNRNADWTAEALVSYKPWSESDEHKKGTQKEESNSDISKVTATAPPTVISTTVNAAGSASAVKNNSKEASNVSKPSGDSTAELHPDASDNKSTIQPHHHVTSQTNIDQEKGLPVTEHDNEKNSVNFDGTDNTANQKNPKNAHPKSSTIVDSNSNVNSNITGNNRPII